MKSFKVQCHCPTPLACNPLTCEAESKEEAQRSFFAANGISGSDHPIEITVLASQEVSEVATSGKGKKKNEPQPASDNQGQSS